MSLTPVLLLDIDGVINACTRTPDPTIWKDWQSGRAVVSDGRSFRIQYSPTVVKFLTGLHTSGQVDIRWHTTWQHDAQAVADLVGLPTFPVAHAPEFLQYENRTPASEAERLREGRPRPRWWKHAAAERVSREEKRPLIWIDDDIQSDIGKADLERLNEFAPALLVCPSEYTGICPRHITRINRFLTEVYALGQPATPQE